MQMSDLMNMASELRQKMGEAQKQAADLSVEGEAGGGMVRVTLNGLHQVLRVRIEPSVLAGPGDLPLVEDLVRAACNSAAARLQEQLKSRLGGMAEAFGLGPDGAGLGGGQ